jgi:hypothetical protein
VFLFFIIVVGLKGEEVGRATAKDVFVFSRKGKTNILLCLIHDLWKGGCN